MEFHVEDPEPQSHDPMELSDAEQLLVRRAKKLEGEAKRLRKQADALDGK